MNKSSSEIDNFMEKVEKLSLKNKKELLVVIDKLLEGQKNSAGEVEMRAEDGTKVDNI